MTNFRKFFLLCAFLLAASACVNASTKFKPSDSRIAYVGRVSLTNPEKAVFTWPGLQLHARFTGTSARLATKPGSGYFMVVVDDMEPFKVHSTDTDSILTLAEGLPEGEHRLTVQYANEGLVMKPEIHGLLLDDGATLLDAPTLPERKIEFIGNSITCGLGNDGNYKAKKFDYSMQNQYYTYEAIASRALNAQCQVVARSGIGIYRNNGTSPKGDARNMQNYYPFTQFSREGERWDFNRYTPDVVCVNLGTNDTSNPGYDTGLLLEGYKKFLKTLRSHYPNAKIVLLSGSMLKGQRLDDVKAAHRKAIEDAKANGDNEIYTFDFTPDDGSLGGYGGFHHPSRERHEKMAEELIPFLRQITGWE